MAKKIHGSSLGRIIPHTASIIFVYDLAKDQLIYCQNGHLTSQPGVLGFQFPEPLGLASLHRAQLFDSGSIVTHCSDLLNTAVRHLAVPYMAPLHEL